MFSKKSMIASQIFIYIISILIFSFIMVYGYNAITGFKGRAEQIASINFKTELTSTIKRVSPDYGTVKKEEFFIGGEYSKVCFVQSYDKEANFNAIKDGVIDPIVKDSFESNVDKNTFLFTDTLQESFDIGKIDVLSKYPQNGITKDNQYYLCIPFINGKAKIKFEGVGDHTCISDWGVDCTP